MAEIKVGKHYQMIRKIGSGAFGEIFEGKQFKRLYHSLGKNLLTKELVAIKMVSKNLFVKTPIGTCEMLISSTRVRAQPLQSSKRRR